MSCKGTSIIVFERINDSVRRARKSCPEESCGDQRQEIWVGTKAWPQKNLESIARRLHSV